MVNLKTEKLAFLVSITGRSTKFQSIHFMNDCGLLLNRSPDTAPPPPPPLPTRSKINGPQKTLKMSKKNQ